MQPDSGEKAPTVARVVVGMCRSSLLIQADLSLPGHRLILYAGTPLARAHPPGTAKWQEAPGPHYM